TLRSQIPGRVLTAWSEKLRDVNHGVTTPGPSQSLQTRIHVRLGVADRVGLEVHVPLELQVGDDVALIVSIWTRGVCAPGIEAGSRVPAPTNRAAPAGHPASARPARGGASRGAAPGTHRSARC